MLHCDGMRIISIKRLEAFGSKHADAEQSLRMWARVVKAARWRTPDEVTAAYPYADPIRNNRVVFNVKGNKYRLVAKMHYNRQIAYVRFIGTHAEYDRINAETI